MDRSGLESTTPSKTSHNGGIISGIMHAMLAKSWRVTVINDERGDSSIIGTYRNITDSNAKWVYNLINVVLYDTTNMLLPIVTTHCEDSNIDLYHIDRKSVV